MEPNAGGLQHLKEVDLMYPIRRQAAGLDLIKAHRERDPNLLKK